MRGVVCAGAEVSMDEAGSEVSMGEAGCGGMARTGIWSGEQAAAAAALSCGTCQPPRCGSQPAASAAATLTHGRRGRLVQLAQGGGCLAGQGQQIWAPHTPHACCCAPCGNLVVEQPRGSDCAQAKGRGGGLLVRPDEAGRQGSDQTRQAGRHPSLQEPAAGRQEGRKRARKRNGGTSRPAAPGVLSASSATHRAQAAPSLHQDPPWQDQHPPGHDRHRPGQDQHPPPGHHSHNPPGSELQMAASRWSAAPSSHSAPSVLLAAPPTAAAGGACRTACSASSARHSSTHVPVPSLRWGGGQRRSARARVQEHCRHASQGMLPVLAAAAQAPLPSQRGRPWL